MTLPYSFRSAVLAALLAAGLTSCGPSYYLTVKPTQPDSEWPVGHPNGHPTLSTNFDYVEVQVGYSHQRAKELLLEVEIRNGSDSAVAINPGSFYYHPVMMDRAVAKKNGVKMNSNVTYVPSIVYAVDPEVRLSQVSARLQKEARKADGTSALEWMTIVGNVAQDLTPVKGSEKEKQAEELRREQERIDSKIHFEEERLQHAQQADMAFVEKDFWQTKVLRKHILKPGELCHGYVVLPVIDQTLLLRVSMPIGERTLIFDFDQERKKVHYEPMAQPVVLSAPPVPPTLPASPK